MVIIPTSRLRLCGDTEQGNGNSRVPAPTDGVGSVLMDQKIGAGG